MEVGLKGGEGVMVTVLMVWRVLEDGERGDGDGERVDGVGYDGR